MSADPARVALLHLARDYKPDQVELFTRNYRQKLTNFAAEVAGVPPKDERDRAWIRANVFLQGSWKWLIDWGERVATWVIETRSIPPGKAKATEMAARTFIKAVRPPRDVAAWWEANARHAYLLLDAISWPERTDAVGEDGVQEKLVVGPFVVHNTLHLTGPKLAGVVEVLEAAAQKIKAAQPSSLEKVLYGEVFVVGQLKQSKTLAWYFDHDDRVYLRPHLKVGRGEVHNLIHELGHRYWFKFLSGTARQAWNTDFYLMKNTDAPRVSVPKPGESVGITFKGHVGEDVKVVSIKPNLGGQLQVELSTGGWVSYDVLRRALQDQAIAAKFPTPYAATQAGEYWAEAFAMHVLGTLPEYHEEKLLRALKG